MAITGVSEFMFGYGFLYEQTRANWSSVRAAPVLPSLWDEANQGWDAHLPLVGTDYYYQFKLSDRMAHPRARFIADGTYEAPYYRIALHKKAFNRQHRNLRLLCDENPDTYYVAPEFDTLDEFNAAFLSSQVKDRSRLIPLTECDDIANTDGTQHYITFQNGAGWLQHSEAKEHRRSFMGRDLERLYLSTEDKWKTIDERFAKDLYEKTAVFVRRIIQNVEGERDPASILDFNPRNTTRGDLLIRTSQLLAVTLGVTLVLVGTKK